MARCGVERRPARTAVARREFVGVKDLREDLERLDESRAGASGCSIDALTGHLRSLGSELEMELLDSMPVWFRDSSGDIRLVSRSAFGDLAREGEVSVRTPVFDLTLSRLGDLRSGGLETPAGSAWHRGLLPQG